MGSRWVRGAVILHSLLAAACGDRLESSAGGFFALLDFRRDDATDPCVNDRVLESLGRVAWVGADALPLSEGGVSCHGALWLFGEDHAPYFSNNPADFPWSDAHGDHLQPTLPVRRLRVPVTIWIADPGLDAGKHRDRLVDTILPAAEQWLRTSRSGLRLVADEGDDAPPTIIDVGTLVDPGTGAPPYPVIGNGCANAMSIVASPLVHHDAHLNVYVVSAINGSNIPAGFQCGMHGAADVIFLDDDSNHEVLLHEIGHALGLSRPDNGHSDIAEGLDDTNLMKSSFGAEAESVHRLSLGQLVRVHASTESWLNLPTGSSGTVRSRQLGGASPFVTTCDCPGAKPTDDCPRLHADVEHGAVPNAPGTPQACRVEIETSCLALAPMGSAHVTMTGFADAGTTPGGGSQVAASLSPSIASADIVNVGPGFARAIIVAGAGAGTAIVYLSIGGNIAPLTVVVGGTCP